MAKKKYWIALGEHAMFTRDDHYVMQVFFTGQANTAGAGLFPKFVDADSLEDARAKLHAFIDERIDHELHMAVVEKGADKIKAKRDAYKASDPRPDSEVDSLSIGGFVNADPKIKKSENDGFLDLETLL